MVVTAWRATSSRIQNEPTQTNEPINIHKSSIPAPAKTTKPGNTNPIVIIKAISNRREVRKERTRHTNQPTGLAFSIADCLSALDCKRSLSVRAPKLGVCGLSLVSRQRCEIVHEAKTSSIPETARPLPNQAQCPLKPAAGVPITGAEALAMANPGLTKFKALAVPPNHR